MGYFAFLFNSAAASVWNSILLSLYLHSCQLVWSTSTKPSKWIMLAPRVLVSPSASQSIITFHLSFLMKRTLCRERVLSAAPNGFIKHIYSCREAVHALSRSCHLNNEPFKQQERYCVIDLLNHFNNVFRGEKDTSAMFQLSVCFETPFSVPENGF